MEVTYTIGGRAWKLRTFHKRDVLRIRGKLGILPTGSAGSGELSPRELLQGVDASDRLLSICSISPRIVLEYQGELGADDVRIDDIDDVTYEELIGRLSVDSGFSTKAADEIRPTSGTSASS